MRRGAKVLEAYGFATSVAINPGNSTFSLRPLPAEAQFSPTRAALAEDFDDDKVLRHARGGPLVVVARNNDTLQLYRFPIPPSQRPTPTLSARSRQ